VESPVIYLAAVPWLVELFWLWRWVPMHARRLLRDREFAVMFGPGFFDKSLQPAEMHWLLAFGLYHIPILPVALAIPSQIRLRFPWLVVVLEMVGTPVLYSGIILWLAAKNAEASGP
jgi:signal transduction histidine kinase